MMENKRKMIKLLEINSRSPVFDKQEFQKAKREMKGK